MKKFATLAAATAIVAAAAAPVAANEANVTADPFVSSQGATNISVGVVAAGVAVGIIAIAALDSSDDT